jgi:hypothetical protein
MPGAYQGYLEQPRGREVVGWVHDPERPGYRVPVVVFLDGELLRKRVASNLRADLKQVGIGDGCHAFSVELPESVFDGAEHRLEVRIEGEPVFGYAYRSRYAGAIESVEAALVRIRLADETRPEVVVDAELWADGRFVVSGAEPEVRVPRGFDVSRVKRLELRAKGCAASVAEWMPAVPASVASAAMDCGAVCHVVVTAKPQTTITAMLRTLEGLAGCSNETDSKVYVVTEDREALEEAHVRLGFEFDPVPEGDFDRVELEPGAIVCGNWLDRLRRAAYADAAAASVSPLVSGPVDGHRPRELDRMVQKMQPGQSAVIHHPSPVCNYVRSGANGTRHLLAGDVRVESFGVTADEEDFTFPALRLRRTVEELRLHARTAAAEVVPDARTVLVERLPYRLPEDVDALRRVLSSRSLTVSSVAAPVELSGSGIGYEVEVNDDYSWICPRGDLIDETGRYCGEPALQACERCLRKLGPREGLGAVLHRCGSVAEWREQGRKLLEGAALVRFGSLDAAERLGRYASIQRTSVVTARASAQGFERPALRPGEKLRVAQWGDAASAIWEACVFDARKRELPLEFVSASGEAHAEWLASEAPPLRVPVFRRFPIQFEIGAIAPGAWTIPCGLPAGRINDRILRVTER